MAAQAAKSLQLRPELAFGRVEGGILPLCLTGDWQLKSGLPTPVAVEKQLGSVGEVRRLTLDASDLGQWGSGLLAWRPSGCQSRVGMRPRRSHKPLRLGLTIVARSQ